MSIYETKPLSLDRIARNEQGLTEVRKLVEKGAQILFDIDDTLKYPNSTNFPEGPVDRFDPNLSEVLSRLRIKGAHLGILTEQSVTEALPFLRSVGNKAEYLSPNSRDPAINMFDAFWICEGGHVIKPTNIIPLDKSDMVLTPRSKTSRIKLTRDGLIVLTSDEALMEMDKLKKEFNKLWKKDDNYSWGYLPGLRTKVRLPPDFSSSQEIGTVSIHEEGSFIGSPDYLAGSYEAVMEYFKKLAEEKKWSHLDFYEAGNGTLRCVQRLWDKRKALAIWMQVGAIDPKKLIYFCDGPNDIMAASLIKTRGGHIITPNNAVSGLQEIADYVAPELVSAGVTTTINKILS